MNEDELYPLIHLADSTRLERGRTHVQLNGQGKAVVKGSAASLFGRMLGVAFVYDILLDEWVEIYDASRLLRTFLSNEEATVEFRVKLAVNSRNAEKVAEAFHHPHRSPSEILFDEIRRVLKTLIESSQREGPETVSQRLFTHRRDWQETIANRLEDRLGLSAKIIFEVPPPVLTRDFRVEDFMVRLKDALHRTVPMTVAIKLAPTTDSPVDTFPNDRDRQQRLLRDAIQEAAINDITLFDYWFEPAVVERAIQLRLDVVCRHYAYRVSQVSLKPAPAPMLHREHIAIELPWQGHRGREVIFQIDADLFLVGDGAGRYDALGRPDRRDWLRSRCQTAVRLAMHNRDFYDLGLEDQETIEAQVRKILKDEAAGIGHDIETVIARARLPENRWLQRQVVEVPVERYPTKSSAVNAEVGAIVELRFNTIRPLIDHVDQRNRDGGNDYDSRIEAELKRLVQDSLRTAIQQVDPNAYFAGWEPWSVSLDDEDGTRPRNNGSSELVRSSLTRELVRDIKRSLSPEIVKVQLSRRDTDYTLASEAVTGLGDFVIRGMATPAGTQSSDRDVPYEIFVRPGHILPEQMAEMLKRGLGRLAAEDVRRSLTHATEEFMQGRSRAELEDLNFGTRLSPDRKSIKVELEEFLCQRIGNLYGFHVLVERAKVLYSEAEDYVRNLSAEDIRLSRANLEARWAYLGGHAEDRQNEARTLREQIARINQRLLDNPCSTEDQIQSYQRDQRMLEDMQAKLKGASTLAAGEIAGRLADQRAKADPLLGPANGSAPPDGGPVVDAGPPPADDSSGDDIDVSRL